MTPFPKCPVCKHSHAFGTSHIWEEEKPDQISRGANGREAAVSASAPVMAGSIKRDDAEASRQSVGHDAQSSRPPQLPEDDKFPRQAYQRLYVRDFKRAKKLNMTVKEYWASTGFNWRDHV